MGLEQNREGLYLDIKTYDQYACANLVYDFQVDSEKSLINLKLYNITQQIYCNSNSRQITGREKIGEIKNWTLNVIYNNKNFQYSIFTDNNSVKVSNINNF